MHPVWCSDLGQHADRGEHGRVVRMVVHDDPGVGPEAVQLGVDVDGRA